MIQDQLREIRRIHDIYDVLGLHRKSAKIVCPLPSHIHASNTPSFSIFIGADGVQRFQCHGNCGKRGDIIDLVGHMNIPAYDDKNPEDVKAAASLLGSLVPVRVPERTIRQVSLSPGAWRNYPLRSEVIEYGRSRGLSPETLERHHVGQFSYLIDGEQRCFMSMPAFEDSVLKAIKFRNTRTAGPRFWAQRGSVKAMFNYDKVVFTAHPVLILKGEIPVMLLSQYGFWACSPTGGEAVLMDDRYRAALSFSARRVLVGDNDRDPQVREKMQAKAQERSEFLRAELRFPPEIYKDIDDWVLAEPDTALPAIKCWLE